MSLKVKNKFLESKDLEKNDHTIDQSVNVKLHTFFLFHGI